MSLESNNVVDVQEHLEVHPAQIVESLDYLEWQKIEQHLNSKVTKLETELELQKCQVASLQDSIKSLNEERDLYKSQVGKLEKELAQNCLKGSKPSQEVNDTVTKAKSVIFEKTKMCKNQELQIDALSQQVKSLKEIVAITKDMLDIRNMEVNQLRDKLQCMELKFEAEKGRHELMHTKLDKMINLNAGLKHEYQQQLELFTQLQSMYRQKEEATEKVQQLKKKDEN